MDRDGQILFVNNRFAEMLGYQPQEMVVRATTRFMTTAGQASQKRPFKRREAGRQIRTTARSSTETAPRSQSTSRGRRSLTLAAITWEVWPCARCTERRRLQSHLMSAIEWLQSHARRRVPHEINNPLAAVMAISITSPDSGALGAVNRM